MRMLMCEGYSLEREFSVRLQEMVAMRYSVIPIDSEAAMERFVLDNGRTETLIHYSLGAMATDARMGDMPAARALHDFCFERLNGAWENGAYVMWRVRPFFEEVLMEEDSEGNKLEESYWTLKLWMRVGSFAQPRFAREPYFQPGVSVPVIKIPGR